MKWIQENRPATLSSPALRRIPLLPPNACTAILPFGGALWACTGQKCVRVASDTRTRTGCPAPDPIHKIDGKHELLVVPFSEEWAL